VLTADHRTTIPAVVMRRRPPFHGTRACAAGSLWLLPPATFNSRAEGYAVPASENSLLRRQLQTVQQRAETATNCDRLIGASPQIRQYINWFIA